ncbi:MAG: Nicotinate dehydrogenase subunit A [Firmicutes bacterium ADurb.Bin373]|jgi:carbon-monoxide dehydrogenase small subunit|nr:MAG: Nicotinate dehydrogenase subunit A [Firmicutes bacterium ADurb.Bin373]
MNLKILKFTLNGEPIEITVSPDDMLVDVLRDKLELTGTKKGCGKGECGACTVIINGEAVNSCLVPAMKTMGANVETIEGIGSPEKFHPVQEAFMDLGAIQCGFCTPGMIMSAKALLDKTTSPTSKEIKRSLSGNICRCTGYVKIEEAVQAAAEKMREKQ